MADVPGPFDGAVYLPDGLLAAATVIWDPDVDTVLLERQLAEVSR